MHGNEYVASQAIKSNIGAAEYVACRRHYADLDYSVNYSAMTTATTAEVPVRVPRHAGAAVESEGEVDVMDDGNVVVSLSSKKSAVPKATIVHDAEPEEEDDTDDSDSDFSAAAGFEFSDDEDVLDLHVDSDDDFRTSFPKNKLKKNMILGGPQPPDPTGLAEDEYEKLLSKFRKERKRYTDKKRNESAKRTNAAEGKPGHYTGCCNKQLNP